MTILWRVTATATDGTVYESMKDTADEADDLAAFAFGCEYILRVKVEQVQVETAGVPAGVL